MQDLTQDGSVGEVRFSRELNLVLSSTVTVALVFLFVSAVFGEALLETIEDEEQQSSVRVPVWERFTQPYATDGEFGVALEVGPYQLLPTENEWNSTHHFVEYALPISEGGAAPDDAVISLAVWRPNVPEGVTVPVIAEFGPYFQEASVETPTIEVPGTWLGQMIIDQILPHGFAFAQVSVAGTGRSNHCMDLMGNAEQLGNDAAVRWLAEQNWSNGAVGMIGKSTLNRNIIKLADAAKGVIDIVYNPEKTPLLNRAKKNNIPFVGGLTMLIEQAKPSFEKWSKSKINVDDKLYQLARNKLK